MRILIVDAAATVRHRDVEIDEAANALRALKLLHTHAYDLVILDLDLNASLLDGMKVLALMRSDRDDPRRDQTL